MSLAARFFGVITAPRATYESIVAHPKWFGMLAVTILIVIVGTTLPMTTEAGREALLETQVRQMQSFGMDVNDQVYDRMRSQIGFAPYTSAAGILFVVPIFAAIFAGVLFLVFNVMMGGTATFKQVFTVVAHAGVISALAQLFTGPLNYFRGSVSSATNLSVLLPMLTEGSFAARLAAMIDFFMLWWVFILAIGMAVLYRRRTPPIALSLYAVYAAIAVVFAAVMSRFRGNELSRNKKIVIAVVVVLVLGAIAFANFKFKRTEGLEVTTEPVKKRHLEAIVSASGKIQPKRDVNISADTMGRVTDLAVDEGHRVTKGQFLLQIDPRNLRTAVQRTEASVAAGRSQVEQLKTSIESSKVALKQAQDNYTRQQNLWKGGLTTRETLERSESDLRLREADLRAQEQSLRTQVLRVESESATAAGARFDLSKVRIESPITGIVTRRNIEEGETVVIGTMNNAGTVLLTIADMSVIQAEVEVDETDIPSVKFGQPAKVTIDAMPGQTFTGKVTEIGNSPIQTGTGQAATQATNFKVVVTLDKEIPEVRPGFTCTAEITTAVRDNVIAVPIQATTVRELIVDDKGNIIRPPENEKRPRRPSAMTAQAAELEPGQTRKELEGVFTVQNNKAVFTPVKTGIAGEKYFEVMSGLKEGDAVITGPFASVRALAEGAAVKTTTATATTPAKPTP